MIPDAVDRQILEILQRNARTPVSEIAKQIGFTSAPVSRRIDRLERAGIIKAYVALVDHQQAGGVEAFIEVRLIGGEDMAEVEKIVRNVDGVQEYYSVSGDADAILRCRVPNVEQLQHVVNRLRLTGKVVGTKTLIVMSSWNRPYTAAEQAE